MLQSSNTSQLRAPEATKWESALERLNLEVRSPIGLPDFTDLTNRTLFLGGKRLRPVLVFLSGRLFGLTPEECLPLARAAELTHAATLAHDDVIDESKVRRGNPTLNAEVGNARAILSGDILLSRVVREIVALGEPKILTDLAHVLEDLSSGEWLQLNSRFRADVRRSELEEISERKTSSLLSWCISAPAQMARVSPDVLQRARLFGRLCGLAFQMVDDLLDYEHGGEKPYAQDLREGLVNFVTFEILDENPKYRPVLQARFRELAGRLEFPWSDAELEAAKMRTRIYARGLLEEAKQILGTLENLGPEAKAASIEILDLLNFLAARTR